MILKLRDYLQDDAGMAEAGILSVELDIEYKDIPGLPILNIIPQEQENSSANCARWIDNALIQVICDIKDKEKALAIVEQLKDTLVSYKSDNALYFGNIAAPEKDNDRYIISVSVKGS